MSSDTTKAYLSKQEIAAKLAKIKALVLDVDGVFTDDRLYMGPDGFEMKRFSIGDGLGLGLILRAQVGLEIIVVSNRHSAATSSRLKELRIKHVVQKWGDKAELLKEYIRENNLDIELSEVAFMGNDILDINLTRQAGVKITVANAHPDLKAEVEYVTETRGGEGAIREVIELYLKGRGIDPIDLLPKQ